MTETINVIGFDIGTQSTKVIILNGNGEVLARAQVFSGFDPAQALKDAVQQALKTANLTQTSITSLLLQGQLLKTLLMRLLM